MSDKENKITFQKYFHLENIIIVDDEVNLEWLHPVLLGVSPVDHVPGARAPGALATRVIADMMMLELATATKVPKDFTITN